MRGQRVAARRHFVRRWSDSPGRRLRLSPVSIVLILAFDVAFGVGAVTAIHGVPRTARLAIPASVHKPQASVLGLAPVNNPPALKLQQPRPTTNAAPATPVAGPNVTSQAGSQLAGGSSSSTGSGSSSSGSSSPSSGSGSGGPAPTGGGGGGGGDSGSSGGSTGSGSGTANGSSGGSGSGSSGNSGTASGHG